MTSADWAVWVTAGGTWAIGFGGLGAFWYAKRTFQAQGEQLQLARRDSLRLRTPVLRAELGIWQSGSALFVLKIWLLSPEAIASLHVSIANADNCPLGFKTGQTGVATWTDEDSLPPGWKHDTTRHEARRNEPLVPGAADQWIMAFRKTEYEHGESTGELFLRAEGTLPSGECWSVPVPVDVAEAAEQRMSIVSR